MTGSDYNVAVSVFFPPYILCEVPSNFFLAKFNRPSYYMGTLVICWGIVMTFTGVVQSFGGLVATRFLLGIFEGLLDCCFIRLMKQANVRCSRFLSWSYLDHSAMVPTAQIPEPNGLFLSRQRPFRSILWSSRCWDSADGRPWEL